MALEHRIESLKKQHDQLKYVIHQEEARPSPDALLLHRLKCQKLNLKDELARLSMEERQVVAA